MQENSLSSLGLPQIAASGEVVAAAPNPLEAAHGENEPSAVSSHVLSSLATACLTGGAGMVGVTLARLLSLRKGHLC